MDEFVWYARNQHDTLINKQQDYYRNHRYRMICYNRLYIRLNQWLSKNNLRSMLIFDTHQLLFRIHLDYEAFVDTRQCQFDCLFDENSLYILIKVIARNASQRFYPEKVETFPFGMFVYSNECSCLSDVEIDYDDDSE